MSVWIRRFGLHLAAAVGATGIFVAAAAVGASQTRQQEPPPVSAPATAVSPTPRVTRPNAVRTPTARQTRVSPERSLAGTIRDVSADGLNVLGVGGREWRVVAAPGALIRLNGRAAELGALQAGDKIVILGQAQGGQGQGVRFVAHALTARRK